MKEILLSCRGTHSFLHQLQSLLNQVDTLVAKTNVILKYFNGLTRNNGLSFLVKQVPPEILAQRLQWPTHLVCCSAVREQLSNGSCSRHVGWYVNALCPFNFTLKRYKALC